MSSRTVSLLRAIGGAATISGILVACGDGTVEPPPPVATSLAVSPAEAALTALGATTQFSAVVRDQSGNPMPGAAVNWSSTDPAVVSVNSSGLATAVAVGSTTVTATAGSASGTATVSVDQAVATVSVSPPSHTLRLGEGVVQFTAVVLDANGHTVQGAGVTWSSSNPDCTCVDPGTGLATPMAPGSVIITASSGAVSGTASLTVLAPYVATSIAAYAGDAQTAFIGEAVATPPVVVVKDQRGAGMLGVTVTFAVTGGGGAVTGETFQTNADGHAAVGSWILGTSPGENSLTATVAGVTGLSVTFTATAMPAVLTVRNATDEINGDTASPSALVARPGEDGISLREALVAANRATVGFTVTFDPALGGRTIHLSRRLPPITRDGTALTGLTRDGEPDISIDGRGVPPSDGPTIHVMASSFRISGMRFAYVHEPWVHVTIGGSYYDLRGRPITPPAMIGDIEIRDCAFSHPGATNPNTFGIFISQNMSHDTVQNVTIADNTFERLGSGIMITNSGSPAGSITGGLVQDIRILRNTFRDLTAPMGMGMEVASDYAAQAALRRVEVYENTFTNVFLGVVLRLGTFLTGSVIEDARIERNVFTGGLQALQVTSGMEPASSGNTISNTKIVNNVVHMTGYGGGGAATIQIVDNEFGGSTNRIEGLAMVNNTVYYGTSWKGPDGAGVWVTSTGGLSGLSIVNNIFWGFGGDPFRGVTPEQVSYSITRQEGFAGTRNNFDADPLFVDAPRGDFRLQAGSPARNAGTTSGAPTIDLACNPRTGAPDLGAYAYGSTGNACRTSGKVP